MNGPKTTADEADTPATPAMAAVLSALNGAKVLVTGGTGFIGRPLTAALLTAGADVTLLARSRPKANAPMPRVILGDMANPAAVRAAVAGHDIIINLAYDVRQSGPANLAAFETLLAAAEAEGRARIIHTSSIVVYDDWPAGQLTETSPMASPGGSAYRQTKIAMERRLMASPLCAAILQPTIVWGPGSALWTDGFAKALRGGGIVLPTPEGVCQGLFVDDLVQAALRAATLPDLARERFIVNGPAPFTWSTLIGGYRDIIGQGQIRHLPASDLRPAAAASAPSGPSPAARISALGRRLLGNARFEKLIASARGLRPATELRPDAHLFALFIAQGTCPATRARERLGYHPEFDLQKGLAATANHLRAL